MVRVNPFISGISMDLQIIGHREEKEYSPIFINDEESPIQNSAQRNRSTR